MTALGQTLPSRDFCGTAALPLKPDIGWRGWHVRKVPLADISQCRKTAIFLQNTGSRNSSSRSERRVKPAIWGAVYLPTVQRTQTDI
jgi:hypothetical protein